MAAKGVARSSWMAAEGFARSSWMAAQGFVGRVDSVSAGCCSRSVHNGCMLDQLKLSVAELEM